jgi:hypothetical protein
MVVTILRTLLWCGITGGIAGAAAAVWFAMMDPAVRSGNRLEQLRPQRGIDHNNDKQSK